MVQNHGTIVAVSGSNDMTKKKKIQRWKSYSRKNCMFFQTFWRKNYKWKEKNSTDWKKETQKERNFYILSHRMFLCAHYFDPIEKCKNISLVLYLSFCELAKSNKRNLNSVKHLEKTKGVFWIVSSSTGTRFWVSFHLQCIVPIK